MGGWRGWCWGLVGWEGERVNQSINQSMNPSIHQSPLPLDTCHDTHYPPGSDAPAASGCRRPCTPTWWPGGRRTQKALRRRPVLVCVWVCGVSIVVGTPLASPKTTNTLTHPSNNHQYALYSTSSLDQSTHSKPLGPRRAAPPPPHAAPRPRHRAAGRMRSRSRPSPPPRPPRPRRRRPRPMAGGGRGWCAGKGWGRRWHCWR